MSFIDIVKERGQKLRQKKALVTDATTKALEQYKSGKQTLEILEGAIAENNQIIAEFEADQKRLKDLSVDAENVVPAEVVQAVKTLKDRAKQKEKK